MPESKIGNRIRYIDIFKAIGIILVVLTHIDYGITAKPWITSFIMPAFFFASGLFLKTDTVPVKAELAFCWKRFQSLMIPYFLWALLYNVIWSVTNTSFNFKSLIYILYGSHQALGKVHTLTSLWFLPPLFLTMVLFSFFRFLLKDKMTLPVKLVLTVALFVAGGFLPKLSFGYPWGVNLVPTAFGFLMSGNVLFPYIKRMRNRMNGRRGMVIFIIVTVISFAGTFLYMFNIPECGYINVANAAYGNYLLFLLIGYIGIVFLLFFSLTLDRMIPEKLMVIMRFFSFYGKNTLIVFVTHKIFIRIFELLFNAVRVPNTVALIITYIGTIAACGLTALLISQYLPILAGRFSNHPSKQN